MRPGHSTALIARLAAGVTDLEAGCLHGGDRSGCIGDLMAPGKPRRRKVHQSLFVLIDHAAVLLEGEEILPVHDDRAAEPLGRFDKNALRSLRFLRADDHRNAALDDSGLLGGDQFDAVAEIGLVVERDQA